MSDDNWKQRLASLAMGAVRAVAGQLRPNDAQSEKFDANGDSVEKQITPSGKPNQARAPMAHPQVLLIDFLSPVAQILTDSGLSVTEGSLGTAYRVEKVRDRYAPVFLNSRLPDLEEKEVVVVNLMTPPPTEDPEGRALYSPGHSEWLVSCSHGEIDPRPFIAKAYAGSFQKVIDQGGVLIVFASAPDSEEYRHVSRGHWLLPEAVSTWDFLPIRWWLNGKFTAGSNIVVDEKSRFGALLARHIDEARFGCVFTWTPHSNNRWTWIPLATNKHGECVAGLALTRTNEDRAGIVLMLPQEMDYGPFLRELLGDVLPDATPHLYPDVVASRWTRQAVYELPRVRQLNEEIAQIKADAARRVQELQGKVDAEREQYGYLHELLLETGEPLVLAVRKTLVLLRVGTVIDADAEVEGRPGAMKREDLRVEGGSALLLVEIKGIGGMPSDAEALQVAKYLIPRMKELKSTSIQGLSIVNHRRNRAPLERDHRNVFRDEILTNAREQSVGLLTTWDLFRLARGFLRHAWSSEQVRGVFYRVGRIDPYPDHYEPLGKVEHVYERAKAVTIELEYGALEVGDRVAFELSIDFEELQVGSLQLEGKKVSRIERGEVAGLAAGSITASLTVGMRVFRFRTPTS